MNRRAKVMTERPSYAVVYEWRIPDEQLTDAPHCEMMRYNARREGMPAGTSAQCTNKATRMRQQVGSLHLSYYCDECRL